jgi:2-phospho-L-lactate transferase/gluconeogenesis factor (CofD/UPF0052 family)
VVYNCNLTNKKGQTGNFDLDKYAEEINNYIGKDRIDFVLLNVNGIPSKLIEKYEKKEGINSIVQFAVAKKEKRSYRVVLADVVKKGAILNKKNDQLADTRSLIRHDSDKLAKVLMMVLDLGEHENIIKEII